MAIFNATPDSFSDGSSTNLDISSALTTISSMLESDAPPSILDIGGMSTRPNSTPCSEHEELDRVVPLIQAIRAKFPSIVISVDTYRPEVARAAASAGADMINDVRGGREEGMMAVMQEMAVPVILMHSRGDSSTMTLASTQNYTPLGGVVKGVMMELGQTVDEALAKGVRGWDIVLDPGIGFAKSQYQSVELLKNLDKISTLALASVWGETQTRSRYPVLVGASRKGFVGSITGRKEAKERGWGDAVINAFCASERGADIGILRVHDWRGALESVKMARALWGEAEER
jgi:dihydroneopterin aldolase/2-amino-4-hydroxy-6-hydroxymethyldihydropteridine diphosphokinase/dihydropteroate synthase